MTRAKKTPHNFETSNFEEDLEVEKEAFLHEFEVLNEEEEVASQRKRGDISEPK